MADSSNGNVDHEYKEVTVEDAGDSKHDVSIVDEIADAAEKILGGGGGDSSSSSSSSSSDDEEEPEPNPAKEDVAEETCEPSNEKPSLVEDFVSIVEAKLEETIASHRDEAADSSPPCAVEAEAKPSSPEDDAVVITKVVEESVSSVSAEAPMENLPETLADASGAPVARESLQSTPWKSCCGLFEVLRRSER